MTSGNGITNIEIGNFLDNETNNDLKRNFMDVYSSDSITIYNLLQHNERKKSKISICNFQHWQAKQNQEHIGGAFLIFIQKRILFDSFGFAGFKQFIVDNDKNIIDKMLFNLEKFNKRDTKTNFVL